MNICSSFTKCLPLKVESNRTLHKYVHYRKTPIRAILAKECKDSCARQFSTATGTVEHGILLPELDKRHVENFRFHILQRQATF